PAAARCRYISPTRRSVGLGRRTRRLDGVVAEPVPRTGSAGHGAAATLVVLKSRTGTDARSRRPTRRTLSPGLGSTTRIDPSTRTRRYGAPGPVPPAI